MAVNARQFHFANAFWFRVPLKALVLTVSVFALVTLWPALTSGDSAANERALFGLAVTGMFVALATAFAVGVNDSIVEVDDATLYVRFEAFFHMDVPLRDIERLSLIDPRPRWRYRFGLSTNFRDRIACSHGGQFVELVLRQPSTTRLWPRRIAVSRLWLAVTEPEALMRALTPYVQRTADEPLVAMKAA